VGNPAWRRPLAAASFVLAVMPLSGCNEGDADNLELTDARITSMWAGYTASERAILCDSLRRSPAFYEGLYRSAEAEGLNPVLAVALMMSNCGIGSR
jgi:hypothetical protein